jgi:DNA polymerase-4
MDAFYASVEMREDMSLQGKAVIVGGSAEGRGVVSAASYEARRFGVHSAMPMVQALRLCPHAVRLPVRMGLYAEVSRQIRAIFARFTPQIEPLALDEAFLDVKGSQRLFGDPEHIARGIKAAIQEELDLTASVGVAPCKYVAKVASDIDKPDGFVVVKPDEVQGFLDPLPVSRLWGAGKRTVAALEAIGIRRIGQLRMQSPLWLQSRLGKAGRHLWELAQGIDPRPVISEAQAKSISHETTFAEDLAERSLLEAVLFDLTEQVAWRLRQHGYKGRTVQLKIRFSDFTTITRAQTLAQPTDLTDPLWRVSRELFNHHWPGPRAAVRLIGMGVSGLRDEDEVRLQQAGLFDDQKRQSALDALSDDINARFGASTVRRGRGRRHH